MLGPPPEVHTIMVPDGDRREQAQFWSDQHLRGADTLLSSLRLLFWCVLK